MEEKTSIRAYYASVAEARVGDAVRRWLRVHGRTVRPRIGPKKVEELKLCFQMMDEDGSGAIDIEELSEAFKAGTGMMCGAQAQLFWGLLFSWRPGTALKKLYHILPYLNL